MTDPTTRILALALEVAAGTPLPESARGAHSQVPARLVDELREALEELGVDWRTFRTDQQCAACGAEGFAPHRAGCTERGRFGSR